MSFSGKTDPMTYDYLTVANFDNDYAGGGRAKVYMQSNAMTTSGYAIDGAEIAGTPFATEGEKNGDMYIYKLGKISLPQNFKGKCKRGQFSE